MSYFKGETNKYKNSSYRVAALLKINLILYRMKVGDKIFIF